MFEDLELPDLERKRSRQLEARARRQAARVSAASRHPRSPRQKRTARNRAIKRKKATQRNQAASAQPTARRSPMCSASRSTTTTCATTTSRTDTREESNAVVLCIMDTSGSMDTMKKYLARSFFFLLYQFICTKYQNVEIVFIAHHTEAKEVTEEEFFHKGESGGTFISSGYKKALDIIEERYHPVALERLRLPLLRRRQLRLRQCSGAESRARTRRHLQSLRLRRDQAARLALLRELDANFFAPSRRRQLPDGADRAQRRHLASFKASSPRTAREDAA